eukprot:11162026-Lingulodinium_polyedra.AAC.1
MDKQLHENEQNWQARVDVAHGAFNAQINWTCFFEDLEDLRRAVVSLGVAIRKQSDDIRSVRERQDVGEHVWGARMGA